VATDSVRVASHDGAELDAHLVVPERGPGPGIVLLHEAGGVTGYVRGVADRLAQLGYVTLVPDLFWRIERNVDLQNDKDMTRALELIGQFDPEAGLRDVDAALSWLRASAAVDGQVGVVGFCFGGSIAYRVACELDPDCAVSYYGVGLESMLDRLDHLTCPALFQFGAEDVFVSPDALERIADAFTAKPNVEIEVYEGSGHAFDNPHAEWHAPEVAARAWDRTAAFLAAHLATAS
jgi:carboxymethylenebutenolidase